MVWKLPGRATFVPDSGTMRMFKDNVVICLIVSINVVLFKRESSGRRRKNRNQEELVYRTTGLWITYSRGS